MKKKVLAFVLVLTMILTVIPTMSVSASSDEWLTFTIASKRMYPTRYVYLFNFIIQDGVPVYGYASTSIKADKWDYDESTHTLNLHDGFDFETTGLIGMDLYNDDNAPFTINIDGNVRIAGRDFGLLVENEAIFTGNGTLTLENTSEANFSKYADSCRPAALMCYDGLTVSGNVTIIAKGTSVGIDGAPITITDNAKIIATGNRIATLSYDEEYEFDSNMLVKGGKAYNSFAHLADVDIVTAEEANLSGDGLYATDYYTLMTEDSAVKSVVMINASAFGLSNTDCYIDCAWNDTHINYFVIGTDGKLKGFLGGGDIVVPEYVTNIAGIFAGRANITSIAIPENVTKIVENAFRDCTGLTNVTISTGITSIGNFAFWGCNELESINIPESVKAIGDAAFFGCSVLASIAIPEGVTTIGESAFWNCEALKNVTLPNTITEIATYTFAGCDGLESVTIPEGVTKIGEGAFSECRALKSVTIPEGVTSIEDLTFSGCSSLESVVIPDCVIRIGSYAFMNCTGLTTITVTDSILSIRENAFDSTNISTVNYPCGVDLDKIKAAYGPYVRPDVTYNAIHDYSSQGVCKVCGCKIFEFDAKSLALDSALAFKFKGYLHDENPADDAYMEFRIGNIRTANVPLTDAIKDSNGRYVFTCFLNALEVDEKIDAIFHDGESFVKRENPLSVTDYLDQVLANHQGGTAEDTRNINIINAISNYTHYAQIALDETHTEYKVGNGGKYVGTAARSGITLYTADKLKSFEAIKTVANGFTDVQSVSRSLVLDDETAILVYITPANDSYVPKVKVTDNNGDDVAFTCEKQADGRYKVAIRGIAAHKLADSYTVDIDDGKLTYTNLSALSYAYSILLNSSSEAYKNAVSTLYDYYIATKEFKNSGHDFGELISEVPATCTEDGLAAYYQCDICGKYFDKDKNETSLQDLVIEAKGHSFATIYSSDNNEHWYACSDCSEIKGKEFHDLDKNNKCKVCGKQLTKTEGLAYALSDDGTYYTVTGIGTVTDSIVIIPATYQGLPVTEIGNGAFENCSNLVSVTAENLTKIGDGAFADCTNLQSVTAKNLAEIGGGAFDNCYRLTSIASNKISAIGNYAFFNCSQLWSVTLLNGCTIEMDAFFGSYVISVSINCKMAELQEDTKNSLINCGDPVNEINCTDGIIDLYYLRNYDN